jgi:hypothetical protein
MRRFVLCLAIAGCARAGKENSIVGGLDDAGPRGDGGIIPAPDASLVDASPQQMTLTQTTSEEIALGASFDCHDKPTGFTRINSYYRVFTLADHSIATTLHVVQVDFGIDTAQAGTGGKQPATVNIGTYGGTPGADTLNLSLVRAVSSASIQIPDGSGTRMTVPIAADIAAGTSLIVELAIPDGLAGHNKFQIAVNAKGERRPGYTVSPLCDAMDPVPHTMQSIAATLGLGETDMVLTVTGNTDVPD